MIKIILLIVIILVFYKNVNGQFGGGGGSKTKKGIVRKEDLPLIGCDVCEYVIKSAYNSIQEKRSLLSSKKKLEEIEVENVIEGICKPDNEYGSWIRKIDIVPIKEKGNTYLKLQEPGGVSKCKNECETIAKSCKNLIDEEIDVDNLSGLLFKDKIAVDVAIEKVCKKLKRCKKRLPLSGKDGKREDEEFDLISEKDLEMEKVMAQMQAAGLGGSMYGRDDLADMMGDDPYGDMGDYDPYGDMGMNEMMMKENIDDDEEDGNDDKGFEF